MACISLIGLNMVFDILVYVMNVEKATYGEPPTLGETSIVRTGKKSRQAPTFVRCNAAPYI